MNDRNNFQIALLIVEGEKARKYDDFEISVTHKFSRRYLKRRKDIIGKSTAVIFESNKTKPSSGKPYRLRLRTVLVAALIIVLACISVIAITKPHIYYVIKEKIDSWDIVFNKEDSDHTEEGFVIIKPQIPDGFTIVSEEALEVDYFLSLENANGENINYEQMLPEGTSISIDSERLNNTTEMINGMEVVVSRDESFISLVFNDGEYIYQIDGNADEKLLRQMMMSVIE